MAGRVKWIERAFDFDFPVTAYPELLQRLRSTPVRLRALVASLPQDLLVRRVGQAWSIQENAGHLCDVESLFEGRLDDYKRGAATLRPAEMTGRKTFEADHNRAEIGSLLARFWERREAYVARLEALAPEEFGRAAMHPRLNKTMRLCDMLFFQAEHDDYHLRRIQELIENRA